MGQAFTPRPGQSSKSEGPSPYHSRSGRASGWPDPWTPLVFGYTCSVLFMKKVSMWTTHNWYSNLARKAVHVVSLIQQPVLLIIKVSKWAMRNWHINLLWAIPCGEVDATTYSEGNSMDNPPHLIQVLIRSEKDTNRYHWEYKHLQTPTFSHAHFNITPPNKITCKMHMLSHLTHFNTHIHIS